MAGVARSLKEAARLTNGTKSLILRASEDLICKNMMCAKLGEACVCRLALTISRLPGLQELDLADNDLGVLPESVFELPGLESLDISGNRLKTLSPGIGRLTSLRTLRVSNNLLTSLPPEAGSLDKLNELHVDGNNELCKEDLQEMIRRRPRLTVVGAPGETLGLTAVDHDAA